MNKIPVSVPGAAKAASGRRWSIPIIHSYAVKLWGATGQALAKHLQPEAAALVQLHIAPAPPALLTVKLGYLVHVCM